MFRIRTVHDDILPINKKAVAQVQVMLRERFPFASEKDWAGLQEKLRNPQRSPLRPKLFVAEDHRGQVKGFALLLHDPELHFCFLDYLSSAHEFRGRGVGEALYERVRREAVSLEALGIFMECLPDDPALSPEPAILKQNRQRLKFYERFGARPIINTAFETPVKPGGTNPPYLVFDDLGRGVRLSAALARQIVRTILKTKYRHVCSDAYIDRVTESFRDDPVRLREPIYTGREQAFPAMLKIPQDKKIVLTTNDTHHIHHVRERGYVEVPVRINAILGEIEKSELFQSVPLEHYPEKHILAVHDPAYIGYIKKVCEILEPGRSVYPYVFPVRNRARPPKDLPVRAGYYCIDTFTPLNANAYEAAKRAVDCALTAADALLQGARLAYALVRPPGHHAERSTFGGFCYLNSNAVAAHYLSRQGKVAILDIDYHHGNGQQQIFFERSDVLTISIHCHPRFAFPYFSGFAEEKGTGKGRGYAMNFPLPEEVDGRRYRIALKAALRFVRRFKPLFLVVPLGLDTGKGDPTGSWHLGAQDFAMNGYLIGELKLPTLIVQEGGYSTRKIGINARQFFTGLWSGMYGTE
jgi:acetoin utilization deacetylase AcuC-like enzyme/GNAT superfamily N-acetyltransferase